MRRAVALLIAFFLLFVAVRVTDAAALEPAAPVDAASIPDTVGYSVGAKAAVLVDAANGRVLFAQNANAPLPMASTTKILTALIALEQPGLDDWFTVDPAAIRTEGSSMGLREGDQVTLRALCCGMLLASGNDAANAAAVRIAGDNRRFAELMNARAAEIGMEGSRFVTPSGLDDPDHYSTAYDMALLAREALQNEAFAALCAQSSAQTEFGNPPYKRWLKNHNRLLRELPGTIGVKTGFTDEAGRCLVSCVEREGVRLIAVTLGCPDDWTEHRKLYERYFGLLTLTPVEPTLPALSIPVTGGEAPAVAAETAAPDPVALLPGETLEAEVTAPPFLYAPVARGQVVGGVTLRVDGQPAADLTLTAAGPVAEKPQPPSLWRRLFGNRRRP